jgi:hypothetical protein
LLEHQEAAFSDATRIETTPMQVVTHALFFDRSNLMLQDIMVFLKSYIEKYNLAQCAKFAAMAYGSTAVNWGSFTRELFKEHFY